MKVCHAPANHAISGASKKVFQTADSATNSVATHNRMKVVRVGRAAQLPPAVQARRLRIYSAQPTASANPAATVSGQW